MVRIGGSGATGVCGLFFVMVGYARVRKDLQQKGVLAARTQWRVDATPFIPDGIRVFAGLAVVEAQLLERLGEGVFARHVGRNAPSKATAIQ